MRLIDADALWMDIIHSMDYCDDILEMIESQPTIEQKSQWIPVSERLPEKPNMYTVTDSKGDVVRFVFTGTESSRKYWQRCAKAWMPLPEPYKDAQ